MVRLGSPTTGRVSRPPSDKLFMPYYSTKGRGSGLGLAIVRRIIAEHGGSIEAADNTPQARVHHRIACLSSASVDDGRQKLGA